MAAGTGGKGVALDKEGKNDNNIVRFDAEVFGGKSYNERG